MSPSSGVARHRLSQSAAPGRANRSLSRSSSEHTNMSARGTPLRRIPALLTSTSEIERIKQVEIEERQVPGIVDQLRILRAAEARMIRGNDIEMLGQGIKP